MPCGAEPSPDAGVGPDAVDVGAPPEPPESSSPPEPFGAPAAPPVAVPSFVVFSPEEAFDATALFDVPGLVLFEEPPPVDLEVVVLLPDLVVVFEPDLVVGFEPDLVGVFEPDLVVGVPEVVGVGLDGDGFDGVGLDGEGLAGVGFDGEGLGVWVVGVLGVDPDLCCDSHVLYELIRAHSVQFAVLIRPPSSS